MDRKRLIDDIVGFISMGLLLPALVVLGVMCGG